MARLNDLKMSTAEDINGVIKSNYLINRHINTYEQLLFEVDRSVFLYNTDKPPIELQLKSPIQFENDYFCNAKSKLSQTDGSGESNYHYHKFLFLKEN